MNANQLVTISVLKPLLMQRVVIWMHLHCLILMDLKGLGNISMHVTALQVTLAMVTMQFSIVLIVLVAKMSTNAMTQAAVT